MTSIPTIKVVDANGIALKTGDPVALLENPSDLIGKFVGPAAGPHFETHSFIEISDDNFSIIKNDQLVKMSYGQAHRSRINKKISLTIEEDGDAVARIHLPRGEKIELDVTAIPEEVRMALLRQIFSEAEQLANRCRRAGRRQVRKELNSILNPVYD